MAIIDREETREERRKRQLRTDAIQERLGESQTVIEDATLVKDRAGLWYHSFKPQNYVQQWFLEQLGVISIRIDRVERIDRRESGLIMLRAETCWDSDRMVVVEVLGGKLGKDPAVVAEKLKATPHGCDWLIKRWSLLAYAADQSDGKGWSPEQASLAFDMLGTPPELRIGRPGLVVDGWGRAVESGNDPAAVARAEVSRLKEIRGRVAPIDESKRFLASRDLSDGSSAELKALRRQESSLHRRLQWFMAPFKYKAAEPRQLHPSLKPEYVHVHAPERPQPIYDAVLVKVATNVEVELGSAKAVETASYPDLRLDPGARRTGRGSNASGPESRAVNPPQGRSSPATQG